jgi:hypothetical protein
MVGAYNMALNVTNSICLYFPIHGWIRTLLSIVRLLYCSIFPTYFCVFLDLGLLIYFCYLLTEMLTTFFHVTCHCILLKISAQRKNQQFQSRTKYYSHLIVTLPLSSYKVNCTSASKS